MARHLFGGTGKPLSVSVIGVENPLKCVRLLSFRYLNVCWGAGRLCMCAQCVWRSEVNCGCQSSGTFHLLFETSSFISLKFHMVHELRILVSPSVCHLLSYGCTAACLAFHVGPGDLNSGSHACQPSTLPAEPSSQPPVT